MSEQPQQTLTIEGLSADADRRITAFTQPNPNAVLLEKTAKQWMESAKTKPIPRMLFSELWYEREVCFLFADTNVGKSILAVQIASSISSGIPVEGFKLEAAQQPVIYCDFEINEKQFEKRYTRNWEDHTEFHPNFLRAEINTRALSGIDINLEDMIVFEIEKQMLKHNAKVLIVDNLTYLAVDSEKTQSAGDLMKRLNHLAEQYGLSILVLCHTLKRDTTQAMEMRHLKGNSALSNLCDAAFAIGRSSRDKDLRYLKQLKQRSCEETYGEDNVIVCQLEKPDNFLQFRFVNFESEQLHLKKRTEEENQTLKTKVVQLHKEGMSYRKIGELLGVSHMAAKRMIESCNKN